MADLIKDILKNKDNSGQDEILIIKEYVLKQFNKDVKVAIGKDRINIETDNSALAGELRFKIYEIQNLLKKPKRLIIRIV